MVAGDQVVVPERAHAPASGGNPVGPDSDCGAAGVIEIDADSLVWKEGIRRAAKSEDVFGVGPAIRGQALHPIEVGFHAFAQVALHGARRLQVDGGVDLGGDARILAAVEDEPMAAHFENLLQQRGREIRPRPLIGQKFLGGHAVLRGAAEIHGDAVEHFRLDLAVPLQQCRIIRRDSFHRLPQGFHLVFAVVGEIFDAREQHHGRRILDHQRVSIHPGRAAVANDADHPGVAAVVHGGIQTALVNQPLLVEVLPNVAGFDALGLLPGRGGCPSSSRKLMLHSADFCKEIRTFTD